MCKLVISVDFVLLLLVVVQIVFTIKAFSVLSRAKAHSLKLVSFIASWNCTTIYMIIL